MIWILIAVAVVLIGDSLVRHFLIPKEYRTRTATESLKRDIFPKEGD